MNKCVFLDRDGVLNVERGDYTYLPEHFEVPDGVGQGLKNLKEAGYLLIVITNQAGISKGLYTKEQMDLCHQKLDQVTGGLIDDLFYSPYHPSVTNSLGRKPGTLLFERALALYDIDAGKSWMVGDTIRDLEPAARLGIHLAGVTGSNEKLVEIAEFVGDSLLEVSEHILSQP